MRVTRVVVGTAGSPGSIAALRYADRMARAYDAILAPVLAWVPPGGDGISMLHPAPYLRQEWHTMACQRMRDSLLAVWGEEPADPSVRPQVEEGPAGWVLVSVARRPGDVLVIGAGRRGPVRRIAGRRVSRYCAAHARCPVILVPPPELTRQAGLQRLAWQLTHHTITAEQIIGDRGQAAPT